MDWQGYSACASLTFTFGRNLVDDRFRRYYLAIPETKQKTRSASLSKQQYPVLFDTIASVYFI